MDAFVGFWLAIISVFGLVKSWDDGRIGLMIIMGGLLIIAILLFFGVISLFD